jgi:glycosyltransferase XagB
VRLAAERRAQNIGVGADRALIAANAITEEGYLHALAAWLGISFEPLDDIDRADCPLDDRQLIQAAAAGLLPLRRGNGLVWVIAPRHLTAWRLTDPRRSSPQWLCPFRLTSTECLRRFVARHTHKALGQHASDGLHRAQPFFSNASGDRGAALGLAAGAALLIAALTVAPAVIANTTSAALCAVFLAVAALRLASIALHRPAADGGRRVQDHVQDRVQDHELSIYTVICALYREAKIARDLVAAIRALHYPGIMAQTPLNRINYLI